MCGCVKIVVLLGLRITRGGVMHTIPTIPGDNPEIYLLVRCRLRTRRERLRRGGDRRLLENIAQNGGCITLAQLGARPQHQPV